MKKLNQFITKTVVHWFLTLCVVDLIVFIPMYLGFNKTDVETQSYFLGMTLSVVPTLTAIYAFTTYKLINNFKK